MSIYLDITRILSRTGAPSPTGIDRVELEYAKHALAEGYFFVAQIGDCLIQVPLWLIEAVIAHLDQRWSMGGEDDETLDERVKRWRKNIKTPKAISNVEKFFRSMEKQKYAQRLKIVQSEANYIRKKAPFIPLSVSAAIVAAFPNYFKRMLVSPINPGPAILFQPMLGENNVYLNVGHTGLEKSRLLGQLTKDASWKIAIYVHDVLPITHPHLFVDGNKSKHEARMENVTRFSDIILANSRFTADETERLYPKAKVDAVLEIGSPPSKHKGDGIANQRQGFVSIGTVEPRKNYLWLVREWLAFCSANPDLVKGEKLTIFGASGWLNGRELIQLKKLVSQSENVEMVHGASDKEIVQTLQNARAYLTAAEVEGWGMPLAESLTLGIPVICTDVAAHREVTRGKAHFFAFDNANQFHEHLLRAFSKEASEDIKKANSFEPWTWEDHFKKLRGVLLQG